MLYLAIVKIIILYSVCMYINLLMENNNYIDGEFDILSIFENDESVLQSAQAQEQYLNLQQFLPLSIDGIMIARTQFSVERGLNTVMYQPYHILIIFGDGMNHTLSLSDDGYFSSTAEVLEVKYCLHCVHYIS